MKFQLSPISGEIHATVNLPASKSIANRALIINALADSPYPIAHLSDSDDTRLLSEMLNSNENHFDIGHAGTAMRFLTAFLSQIVGEWSITGSARMKQRPIKILVDALNQLGAHITYPEKEGFPPLKITGSHLKGKTLELDGSISSQYISALLMIAPTLEGGLTLLLKNEITSRSYIELTLRIMNQFGIDYHWENTSIHIEEQNYRPLPFFVEADWSGASYWYELLCLSESGRIELKHLYLNSIQGDSQISKWFEQFGIHSEQQGNNVIIRKIKNIRPNFLQLNFLENPDMAQTMAVLCVLMNVPFHFTGLATLKIKETDRMLALQNELGKFGAQLIEPSHGELAWDGQLQFKGSQIPCIKTYHDHRMALAFAPACLVRPIEIDDPMVVTKSYPRYYEDLKTIGIQIQEKTL